MSIEHGDRETVVRDAVRITSSLPLTLRIRERKVVIWPQQITPEARTLLCLLALDNPEVDKLLCQLNTKFLDSEGQIIFDYRKGGWVK